MFKEAFQAAGREEHGGKAFPAYKMQHGIGAAKSFASWGFGKVVWATKVRDRVAQVDPVQEAFKIAQKTDQALQKGVQKVMLSGKRPKVHDMYNAIVQLVQVSKITGAASTKALGHDLQPGLEQTPAALQVGEFAAQMKLRIMEAHEDAKKKICKAASKTAATAAWFQTKHQQPAFDELL